METKEIGRPAPAAGPKRYGVILMDPPWQYRNKSARGAAAKHYGTMSLTELRRLPVQRLAAGHCVLLMWATWPCLPEAMALGAWWGFGYVTGLPWIKVTQESARMVQEGQLTLFESFGDWGQEPVQFAPKMGTGFWVRGCSELMLIWRRGHPRPPAPSEVPLGLLSKQFRHSKKPDNIHDLAECIPAEHRLEMFARERRTGWDVFGNEVEGSIKLETYL